MESTKGAYTSSVKADDWEPFVEEGVQVGEVHWLRQTQGEGGVLFAGLWRRRPEEHPEGMPYKVAGSETFHVTKFFVVS